MLFLVLGIVCGIATAQTPPLKCKAPAVAMQIAALDGVELGCARGDVREGRWRRVDPTGRVLAEGAYKDGKKHGVWTGYQADGKKAWTATWRAGIQHGPSKRYDMGRVKVVNRYVDGLREGVDVEYHPNGRIQSLEHYVAGKKQGVMKGFDELGRLRFEAGYDKGELHGWRRELCENGKAWRAFRYEHGSMVESLGSPPPDKIPCSEFTLP